MALTATSVTSTATNVPPVAVPTTSESVAGADIGVNGALLNVINNSGGTLTVTLPDPGATGLGNAGQTTGQTIATGADRWFRLSPGHVNQNTGNTPAITFSTVASVTYKLVRC